MPFATALPQRRDIRRVAVGPLRAGPGDPTTTLGPCELRRCTLTPDGPATVHVRWSDARVEVRSFGPGGPLLESMVPAMLGDLDTPFFFAHAHPVIAAAQHRHPGLRLGASNDLYHDLLPTILGQRITAGEAFAQWRRLCVALGEAAPGPDSLRLPPRPERLLETPTWSLHRLGIERRRAEALQAVARHADRMWGWAAAGSVEAMRTLQRIPGVGEWTIGVVLGTSLGEPDAVAVGDFHLKNTVAWALAREPRGTDERMLELLEPYRGQRGRVIRLLALDGHGAPKFGPRQRILPMAKW